MACITTLKKSTPHLQINANVKTHCNEMKSDVVVMKSDHDMGVSHSATWGQE
jgi:hypothetical protein